MVKQFSVEEQSNVGQSFFFSVWQMPPFTQLNISQALFQCMADATLRKDEKCPRHRIAEDGHRIAEQRSSQGHSSANFAPSRPCGGGNDSRDPCATFGGVSGPSSQQKERCSRLKTPQSSKNLFHEKKDGLLRATAPPILPRAVSGPSSQQKEPCSRLKTS